MTKPKNNGDQPQLDKQDAERVQQALKRGWNRRDVMKMMMASGITAGAAHQLFSE